MSFDISIIIRTYNEERFISELLDSIAKQKIDQHYEVILVDSESTDSTVTLARQFKFVKILSIPKSSFTFGYSLNYGIKNSQGSLIVAISGHCLPNSSDWLENLLKPFRDPSVGYVFGRQIGIDEKRPDHPSTRFSERRIFKRMYPSTPKMTLRKPYMNNANSAFRRALWNRFPFDEGLTGLEDLDFALKCSLAGIEGAYASDAVVVHLHDENNARVFNRFFREELAVKQIDPARFRKSRIGILYSFFAETLRDFITSISARGGVRRFYISIVGYRLAQYYAIYLAHGIQTKPLDAYGSLHNSFLMWITKGRCSIPRLKIQYSIPHPKEIKI